VVKGVDRLVQWGGRERIVWNATECTHIDNPQAKVTPAQLRAEVWMSLVHGSRGIIYFVHEFKPRSNDHALLDDPPMLAILLRRCLGGQSLHAGRSGKPHRNPLRGIVLGIGAIGEQALGKRFII
jgi:hypothetical protein